jgi:glycerophosphoryl diester phosphodiesterase
MTTGEDKAVAQGALATLAGATRDFVRDWRTLAGIEVFVVLLSFVVITPTTEALLRMLVSRSGNAAMTDVDIALFFFTTKSGFLALLLLVGASLGITIFGQACLMTVGIARAHGGLVRVRDAVAHGATRAISILQLTLALFVRVLVLLVPFVAGIGAAYWLLLREHDINYYLHARPPVFFVVCAIVAVLVLLLTILLMRKLSSWLLILPLVVFERMQPWPAFAESARRMSGHRLKAVVVLALWGVLTLAVSLATSATIKLLGRTVAPAFGGTMMGLLVLVGAIATVWALCSLAVNIFSASLFALILARLFLATGPAAQLSLPARFGNELEVEGKRFRVSWATLMGALALAVIVASGLAYVLMKDTWTDRSVVVFAHRGASASRPENTLASFRRAGEEHADFVELDVQESSDGVVLVAHDRDLMKVARSPLQIWSSPAQQLREVDIGSYFSAEFKDERVPTLAEALEVCKGVCRMNIELKDYGKSQHLEERVVEVVESAGMQNDVVTMSLNHRMVENMKRLRPNWRAGLLAAKAIGEPSRLPFDFLAVESRMATRAFIRTAHAAHKPVYVWTVNDPQRMVRMIGLGADGLITDRPALAREVLARYAEMTQAERLLLFAMAQLGVREEISEPEDDLRP